MHTTQALLGLAAIYVVHVLFAEGVGPCRVVRRSGVTILAVDPRASKIAVHAFCFDNLTVAEQNALRVAMEEPRVGEGPLSDRIMEGDVGSVELPESLRLPFPLEVLALRPDRLAV